MISYQVPRIPTPEAGRAQPQTVYAVYAGNCHSVHQEHNKGRFAFLYWPLG